MISGCGRSAGAVIPALGSGRYSPGPHIVWPSWLKGSDPHCTINVFWGQPGALATVSTKTIILHFYAFTFQKLEKNLRPSNSSSTGKRGWVGCTYVLEHMFFHSPLLAICGSGAGKNEITFAQVHINSCLRGRTSQ